MMGETMLGGIDYAKRHVTGEDCWPSRVKMSKSQCRAKGSGLAIFWVQCGNAVHWAFICTCTVSLRGSG